MAKKQKNSRAPRITSDQFMQLRFLESRVPGIRFSEDDTVLEYFPADSDEQEIVRSHIPGRVAKYTCLFGA